ncbi:MAG: hypothetical protein MUC39_03240 [Candidatus Omnitrophica bacterium]|jgi:hypothetical protein|nr:hypothetical protein [Candidatus Omnitrophota bacterium]
MKKVKTELKGRKCKFPRCKHTLSVYNHEAYCHVHLGQGMDEPKQKVHRI